MPVISLITAVRNGAAYIARAIESVLSQNYPDLDYIVMDGASVDGTAEILERYRSRLGYLESKPDNSLVDAYNKALARARGELIGILNADDILAPGFLRAIGAAALTARDALVLCGSAEVRDLDSGQLIYRVAQPERLTVTMRNALSGLTLFNAKFYRRETFDRFGEFAEDFPGHRFFIATDRHFLIRLALAKVPSVPVPEATYVYYRHPASLTFSRSNVLLTLEENLWMAERFLEQNPDALQRRQLLSWRAEQQFVLAVQLARRGRLDRALALSGCGLREHPFLFLGQSWATLARALRNRLEERANRRAAQGTR
jgi:glycosyltransferase involved in cell wall biosynthesis